jgi:nicotinamide riboside kinase
MKDYQVSTGPCGVRLDADFLTHQTWCNACSGYDPTRLATLAACCLEGVVLLKREAPKPKPKKRERGEHYASKELLATVRRYR